MYKNCLRGFLLCIGCYIFGCTAIEAQQPGGTGKFTLFFEKLYLHLDRTYYSAGDDIWLEAYVTDAQTGHLTNTSHNVYAELIAPDGAVVGRKIIRVDNGVGNGDFHLEATLTAGIYRVRAYTNWMRNFGNMFLYEKDLLVSAGPVPAGGNGKPATTNHESLVVDATKSQPAVTNRLVFFPEGGSLVTGVNSLVAFKAEDAAGKGIAVKGAIVATTGKTIGTIQSTYRGMGSFMLQPEAGVAYQVRGQYANGRMFTADLPAALEQGMGLHIAETDTMFTATISVNAATLQVTGTTVLTLAGRHGGRICFEDTVRLQGTQAVIQIPRRVFPEGVAAITVYDAQLTPHCERLVYVEKAAGPVLQLRTDKAAYAPGEAVSLQLDARDAAGAPAAAQLSLAVVDAGIVPETDGDIRSYLLLQSELRGPVERAQTYIDPANAQRAAQRDLLLCTQGWRDFLWRRVKDTVIVIRYLPEQGITLSGHVKHALGGKPMAGMNITLMAGDAKGNKLYFTQTDSAGAYFLDGLPLYGSQPLRMTSRDNKGKKGGMLLLDSVIHQPLPSTSLPVFSSVLPDTAAQVRQFVKESLKRKQLENQQQEADTRQLESVTVKNSTAKIALFRDGAYMSFGGPDSAFNITPADMKDYGTLENFLLHRMPGTSADAENQGVFFLSSGQRIRARFKVDNVEDVFERLDYYTLPMDVIERVTVRHMLSATAKDAWFIYLTLKPEAFQKKQMDLLNTTVTGYYEARTFYTPPSGVPVPNWQDTRTTLFWQPHIEVKAGEATVSYRNGSAASKVRVVAEGITSKGEPVAAMVTYNIK